MSGNQQWSTGVPELGDAIQKALCSQGKRAELKRKVKTDQGREVLAVEICMSLYPAFEPVRNKLKDFGTNPAARRSATREALRYLNSRLNNPALV